MLQNYRDGVPEVEQQKAAPVRRSYEGKFTLGSSHCSCCSRSDATTASRWD